MSANVSGKVLRALGGLAGAADKVQNQVEHYVHVAPLNPEADDDDPDRHYDLLEVAADRAFVRVTCPGGVDDGMLMDKDTTQRLLPKDTVLLTGREVRAPFQLALEPDDGSGPKRITYPDLETALPDEHQKAAFALSPKRLQQLAACFASLGCATVEVLLPRHAGGHVGFRGVAKDDDRV